MIQILIQVRLRTSTKHPKFDLTRIRTHDLQIMAVHFISLKTPALTTLLGHQLHLQLMQGRVGYEYFESTRVPVLRTSEVHEYFMSTLALFTKVLEYKYRVLKMYS